jgi:hypothetical protein
MWERGNFIASGMKEKKPSAGVEGLRGKGLRKGSARVYDTEARVVAAEAEGALQG